MRARSAIARGAGDEQWNPESSAGPAEPTAKVRNRAQRRPGRRCDAALVIGSAGTAQDRPGFRGGARESRARDALRGNRGASALARTRVYCQSYFLIWSAGSSPGAIGIEDVVGRGSTSMVSRRHLELASVRRDEVLSPAGADVADEAMHDQFEFEAQVLASMRHPQCNHDFDLGTTEDGLRYIVMELLQGENWRHSCGASRGFRRARRCRSRARSPRRSRHCRTRSDPPRRETGESLRHRRQRRTSWSSS